MVRVNGTEFPMRGASGILAVETPDGHQSWALVMDAAVSYGEGEFDLDPEAQFTLTVELPPGELLRQAHTFEAGEENVLVYSRLLVAVLREERERYAELQKQYSRAQRERVEAIERRDDALADQDEMLRSAWRHGAAQGWFHGQPMQGKTLDEVLELCPHPEPDAEEL